MSDRTDALGSITVEGERYFHETVVSHLVARAEADRDRALDREAGTQDALDETRRRVTELEAGLREAVSVIEGLADQQAMVDDWYQEPLSRLATLAEYGGGS